MTLKITQRAVAYDGLAGILQEMDGKPRRWIYTFTALEPVLGFRVSLGVNMVGRDKPPGKDLANLKDPAWLKRFIVRNLKDRISLPPAHPAFAKATKPYEASVKALSENPLGGPTITGDALVAAVRRGADVNEIERLAEKYVNFDTTPA